MSLTKKTVLKRIILGFGDDGSYSGGQADWATLFVDDETGEIERGRELVGQPLRGALQPNEALDLAAVFTATEFQRVKALDDAHTELEDARAEHRTLRDTAQREEVMRESVEAERDALKAERDALKAERDARPTRNGGNGR